MPLQDTQPRILEFDGDRGYAKTAFTFGTIVVEAPQGAFETPAAVTLSADTQQRYFARQIYDHPRVAGSPIAISLSAPPQQPIAISFSSVDLLNAVGVRILRADDVLGVWQEYAESSCFTYTASFAITESGTYGVVYNDFPLCDETKVAAWGWPRWAAARKTPDSIVQRVENAMFLETGPFKRDTTEIIKGLFLETCPTNLLDAAYRADLPSCVTMGYQLTFVSSEDQYVAEVRTPDELAKAFDLDLAYVNYDTKVAYFSKPHDHVLVSGRYEWCDEIEILPTTRLEPVAHHVWNRLDEFGLLLSLPRLNGEANMSYRRRMLDSAAYPADSSRQGLIHAIAKRMGFIRAVLWEDAAEPLVIDDAVMAGSVRLDGIAPKEDLIRYDEARCTISPVASHSYDGSMAAAQINVTYIRDVVKVHNLADFNPDLYMLLWDAYGGPTSHHKQLAHIINSKAPIMWGYLKSDEAWWDPLDVDLRDLASVPPIYDVDIFEYLPPNREPVVVSLPPVPRPPAIAATGYMYVVAYMTSTCSVGKLIVMGLTSITVRAYLTAASCRVCIASGGTSIAAKAYAIAIGDIEFVGSNCVYFGSYDNTVRKISPSGSQVWSYTGHTNFVLAVAVDPSGDVYSVSYDNTVHKISPSGTQVWSYTGHTSVVNAVAVDPSGYVYSGSNDNTVRKISPSGAHVWSYTGHTYLVYAVAVDSSGNVYSGSLDNTVRKISPSGAHVWSYTGHTSAVWAVAVDPSGNVYSGSFDYTVRKISPSGSQVWSYTGHTSYVYAVAVDPLGNVYSGSYDNTVRKISPSGSQVWSYTGHTSVVYAVAVDPGCCGAFPEHWP